MPQLADIDTFGLALPDEWTNLPLEQSAFDRFCSDLSARWRAEPTWDRTTERKADVLLHRVRNQLVGHGASFAGVYFDAGVPDGAALIEENLEPLMAACTFSIYTRTDLDTDLPLTLPILYSAFAKRADPDTRFGNVINVQPPSVQRLPVGRAVRLRRLCKPRGFGAGTVEPFYVESFILPVDDDGRAAAALQLATTNVDVAQQFSELFLAIAQTITVLTPDDPTAINAPVKDAASWPI